MKKGSKTKAFIKALNLHAEARMAGIAVGLLFSGTLVSALGGPESLARILMLAGPATWVFARTPHRLYQEAKEQTSRARRVQITAANWQHKNTEDLATASTEYIKTHPSLLELIDTLDQVASNGGAKPPKKVLALVLQKGNSEERQKAILVMGRWYGQKPQESPPPQISRK